MEETFENLKKEGKSDVDSLIKWMKEASVIEDTKTAEEDARTMFSDVVDKQSVELEKFKDVVGKIATEQKKNVDDFFKSLAEKGADIQNALADAVAGAMSTASDTLEGLKK